MRTVITLFFLLVVLLTNAQTIYIPPVPYDEDYQKSIGFWENLGQIIDTDGNKRDDILYYSEGGFPRVYAQKKSKVSFVIARADTSVSTVDTLYRLDMRPYGATANQVSPVAVVQKDWVQNFYLPHCGATGAEDVHGYSRLVYNDIYHQIDMHFYSGSMGQKMAFVMRPGCTPSNLKLAFEGQDSIAVDLWGNLKLYKTGKYFVIPYVQAYQVNTSGTVVPVNWSASYQVNNGTGIVSFAWSSYNPFWPLVFQMGIPPLGPSSYDEFGACWSTYMGGDGNDEVTSSTLDEYDNYYLAGQTSSAFLSFPFSPGTNLSTVGTVGFITQFNDLNQINWKTFVGGNLDEFTRVEDIVQREGGEMYVVGVTQSHSLPTAQPNQEHFQGTAPATWTFGAISFVGRFAIANGNREWLTYFGTGENALRSIAALGEDHLFIGGSTRTDLPPLDETAPFGSTYWGPEADADGILLRLNVNDRLDWRTHLPGDGYDEVREVATGTSKVAAAGGTTSTNMILVDGGANDYSVGSQGGSDAFLYEFNSNCVAQWSTYVGGTYSEDLAPDGLSIESNTQDVAIGGSTEVIGFSIVPGPNWYQDGSFAPSFQSSFIVRFSGIDRSRVWSTIVSDGGNCNTQMEAIYFSKDGDLFATGFIIGDAAGELIVNSPGIYNQTSINVNLDEWSSVLDGFVLRFDPNIQLKWGTYYGGEAGGWESVRTILKRPQGGYVQIAGTTSKDPDHILSYFPLDDGAGVPYFTNDWGGSGADVFAAAFCIESTVGLATVAEQGEDRLQWTSAGHGNGWIHGLARGTWRCEVFDPVGQIAASVVVVSSGTEPVPLKLPELVTGQYLLRLAGSALKITVLH